MFRNTVICSEKLFTDKRRRKKQKQVWEQYWPAPAFQAVFSDVWEKKPCLSKCAQSLQHMCSTGACLLLLLLYIFCISKVKQRVTHILRAETRRHISDEKRQKRSIQHVNKKNIKNLYSPGPAECRTLVSSAEPPPVPSQWNWSHIVPDSWNRTTEAT